MSTTVGVDLDFMERLSEEQKKAVEHEGGPLAVLAGPGAGKTRVIVNRVARLALPVERGGVGAAPASIVALAFTNKSAEEMRERLSELLGATLAGNITVSTCHSFGRGVLRRFADVIGLPARVRVMDSAAQRRFLRRLTLEHDLFRSRQGEGVETLVGEAIAFIKECQNAAVEPAVALAYFERETEKLDAGEIEGDETELDALCATLPISRDMARLFQLYDAARLPEGRLTLDDFIALPVRILRRSEPAAAILRNEARHIVVDEFQDWNPAQIELLRLLAPETPGRTPPDVCVVGDDDQSIYAFRGADDRAFARFEKHWPSVEVVRLATNYRSAPEIVNAAGTVIARAEERFDPDKEIKAHDRWDGDGTAGIEGVIVENDRHLGAAIGAMIKVDRAENNRAWSEYAVLARTGGTQQDIAADLEDLGIPVAVKRKATPLDDPAVLDLLSWMRLLAGEHPGAQAQRLLARPMCGATYDEVSRWRREWRRTRGLAARADSGGAESFLEWLDAECAEALPVQRLLRTRDALREKVEGVSASDAALGIILGAGLIEAGAPDARERAARIARLGAVRGFISECGPDLDQPGGVREFLEYYDDLSDREKAFARASESLIDEETPEELGTDAVAVLTAHASKGLEFDTVFVARCRPRLGFPQSEKRDEVMLPIELTGRNPGSLDDEERRLFYVACTRAKRRLVLLAKKKKSKDSSKDYFLQIGEDLGPAFAVSDAERWLERAEVALPEMIDDGESRTARLDRAAVEVRREGVLALRDAEVAALDDAQLDVLRARLTDAAERLAMIAHLRETGKTHTSLSALDPVRASAIETLAATRRTPGFAPMEAPLMLSYSMINDYLRCPACFYVKRVLKFESPTSSALTLGKAVHGALERFYVEVRDAEADGGTPPGKERLLSLGAEILRREWPDATPVDPGSFEKVNAQLDLFWEKLHDPDAELLLLEGEGRGGAQVAPFPYEHRGTHTMIAKLDRVDRLPDGGFRIIDYKTGAARKSLLEPKKHDHLQLSIYAMALQHHLELEEPPSGTAEYWVVATGQRGVIGIDELKLAKAKKTIDEAIDGMLDGRYDRKPGWTCDGLCEILG